MRRAHIKKKTRLKARRISTVSYTHLDVYKRQPLGFFPTTLPSKMLVNANNCLLLFPQSSLLSYFLTFVKGYKVFFNYFCGHLFLYLCQAFLGIWYFLNMGIPNKLPFPFSCLSNTISLTHIRYMILYFMHDLYSICCASFSMYPSQQQWFFSYLFELLTMFQNQKAG